MNTKQLRTLIGLARDQAALKQENGWYGQPVQGLTTRDEDIAAIAAAEAFHDELLEQGDGDPRAEFQELVTKLLDAVNGERLDRVQNVAYSFWGYAVDGDGPRMTQALRQLRTVAREVGL